MYVDTSAGSGGSWSFLVEIEANKFFVDVLKVSDENSRIMGMDPRIRIRTIPKLSWIRKTGKMFLKKSVLVLSVNTVRYTVLDFAVQIFSKFLYGRSF